MNKRKTSLEKLITGARFEGIKPNIPRSKPTATGKLARRLREDDVDIEKILPILMAVARVAASAASSVGAAAGSAAGAVGGAVARGASAVGRGAARSAKSAAVDAASSGGEAPVAEEVPEATPPPQEEPEDEMEEEAQQAPTKRDTAIAELSALAKATESTSNRQAPEFPPRSSLGVKRIDWKKKERTDIKKEGDGGNGGDGEGGGGTVFTSTNAGIFTPTHGGGGSPYKEKPKKKKRSTGIERLGRFLTDGSPVKLKDVEKSAVFNLTELLNEVKLDLRKEKKQVPYGSKPTENDPPQMVERNNPSPEHKEPKKRTTLPKSDEELKRDKVVDESKQSHGGIEEPYSLNLQQWGSGHAQYDELKRGGKGDILTPPPESDEEETETTIPEDPDLKVVGTEGYEKYLKYLQKMEKEGDDFPLMNAFWKAMDDKD